MLLGLDRLSRAGTARQRSLTDVKPPFPEKYSRCPRLCSKLARMTLLVQGFLLGLANGASCLATCAPVLLPYLVGEGRTVRWNATAVFHFLAGRLAGYLIFAVFAWEAGQWFRSSPRGGLIFGAVYATLAIVLVIYGFSSPANTCAAGSLRGRLAPMTARWPSSLPVFMGLLTGLSLCPPFLAALAGATSQATLFASLLFFFAFFIATSIYVTPFPLAGLLGRSQAIRTTGRLAAGVMGIYYFYRGLIMIYGGLQS
jgi:sulfite exporter TauE/SafE